MLLRGARLARRLCSRAGPAEAALSRAPPLLREYLKIAPEDRKVCSFERAGREGMEKVLGIGAEVFELLPYDRSRGNHRQAIKSWSAITKAREVFIAGLPRFNTTEAYEKSSTTVQVATSTESSAATCSWRPSRERSRPL